MKKKKVLGDIMTERLTARHTGNAGVLINIERTLTGKKKRDSGTSIGIDVFCRNRKGLYQDTPPSEREMLLGKIESRELQTLVFTHTHDDHFCLQNVLEALEMNPQLRIISTRSVIHSIRAESAAGILTEISPEETGMVTAEPVQGIKLTLFNSPHMGEQFADVQNLVCLLEISERKIMIPGDARPDAELFERTAGWSPAIDWLIGPFPLLGLPSSRKKIAAALAVRHVLALHLPRPERDVHGWRDSAEKVCRRAEDGIPMPLFGDVIGRTYVL